MSFLFLSSLPFFLLSSGPAGYIGNALPILDTALLRRQLVCGPKNLVSILLWKVKPEFLKEEMRVERREKRERESEIEDAEEGRSISGVSVSPRGNLVSPTSCSTQLPAKSEQTEYPK